MISEPKISGARAKTVANSLGFSKVSIEDATGFSGGIWLMWNNWSFDLQVVDHNMQAITAKVTEASNKQWYFTTVYASPSHHICADL